jgi:sterol desaturase/sphingolipid hydroxylase (fatty acid hydroxylase superfamily)
MLTKAVNPRRPISVHLVRVALVLVLLSTVLQALIAAGPALLFGQSLPEWRAIVAERALPKEMLLPLAVLLVFLAAEIAFTGWRKSSLRKLVGRDARSREDLGFAAIALLGIQPALATIATLGLYSVTLDYLGTARWGGPLSDASPWLGAPLLYCGMAFCNYWGHRLLHTPFLWPLHAIHHAPRMFTIVNAARVSALESAQIALCQALTAAILGGSPETLYGAALIAGLESLWTHSNIRGVEWLEKFGINSPKAHMIHHAIAPQFHNRNFGDMLCIWDKLFGTFIPSSALDGELELGVEDPEGLYYGNGPLGDCFLAQWMWTRRCAMAVCRRVAPRRSVVTQLNVSPQPLDSQRRAPRCVSA